MEKIPDSCVLIIVDYMNWRDRFNITSLNKYFHDNFFKQHVSQIVLRGFQITEEDCAIVWSTIVDQQKQLAYKLDEIGRVSSFPFSGLRKLECEYSTYLTFVQSFPTVPIKEIVLMTSRSFCYELNYLPEFERPIHQCLEELKNRSGLDKITLIGPILLDWADEDFIPEKLRVYQMRLFESCSEIFLSEFYFLEGLAWRSSSNLRKLTLHEIGELRDVSMLGNIPDLTIDSCRSLVDVSSLNDNCKLSLIHNGRVGDFSRCGANSEVIEIVARYPNGATKIDLSHWKKVRALTLKGDRIFAGFFTYIGPQRHLPATLKRCTIDVRAVVDELILPRKYYKQKEGGYTVDDHPLEVAENLKSKEQVYERSMFCKVLQCIRTV